MYPNFKFQTAEAEGYKCKFLSVRVFRLYHMKHLNPFG